MPSYSWQVCKGPIPGLRLPLQAWTALERDNIATLDQLTAAADRIERVPGVGPKMAETIRAELARVAIQKQHPDGGPTTSSII
jgi:Holliday junction resolvasome RuvABC DNA-binding subunit